MDIQELMGQLLSKDSVKNLGKVTGSTQKEVKSVLSSGLPSLIQGLTAQANDESTAEGFANALNDHAKDSTADLKSFLSNVDIADGGKILSHLLGNQKEETTSQAASTAGVSSKKAGNILSAVAPLLLSLVGQQSGGQNTASGVGSVIGNLVGNVDIGSVLSGLTGSQSNSGGLLSGLLGLFRK